MRIAILGAGRMGAAHALAYAGMRDVHIAGIASRGSERAEELAEEVDALHVTDPYALLDDDSVDAVDVVLPTDRHREFVLAAVARGKHVLCEVPVAWTADDADAMAAAADEDTVVAAALLTRFVPEFVEVRDVVRSGSLGAPRTVSLSRLCPPYATSPDAHYGDVLVELAPLDFDYLRWLLEPPTEVSTAGIRAPDGWVDHAVTTLAFPDAVAQVETGADLPKGFAYRTRLRVVCDAGAVESTTTFGGTGPPEVEMWRWSGAEAPVRHEVASRNPHAAVCAHFVDCARGEADPALISIRHACEALRVGEAARDSLRRGVPVEIL